MAPADPQDPLPVPRGSPAESGSDSASASHLPPAGHRPVCVLGTRRWPSPAARRPQPQPRSAALCVATCMFPNADTLPATFPRCCHSPSDCHTDNSSSQVLGVGGGGGERQSPDLGRGASFRGGIPAFQPPSPARRSPRPQLHVPTCSPRPRPVPSASLAASSYVCLISYLSLPSGAQWAHSGPSLPGEKHPRCHAHLQKPPLPSLLPPTPTRPPRRPSATLH